MASYNATDLSSNDETKYIYKLSKRYGRIKRRENIIDLLSNRGLLENDWRLFKSKAQVSHSLIGRLGLVKELEGHCGCVNCIEFNINGRLLLSGSDDFSINLWDVNTKQKLKSISTGHRGNIFSVKFLPESNELIASGAGDCRLEVREIHNSQVLQACSCHSERIKRIATVPCDPSLLFTASEDGTVLQFDLRQKHTCSSRPKNVLINLKKLVSAEVKCATVHPTRPELIAVGANDPYVRIYDRRMIKLTRDNNRTSGRFGRTMNAQWERQSNSEHSDSEETADDLPAGCVQYFVPGHLPSKLKNYYKRYRSLATTYLSYSADGHHLLANLGGDHIYLFDTLDAAPPISLTAPPRGLDQPVNGELNDPNVSPADPYAQPGFRYSTLPMYLPPASEALRQKALRQMQQKEFTSAIHTYNSLLLKHDRISSLYSARAAVLMERKWDGDIYAALRDCHFALDLDPSNAEAKYRQIPCLHLLKLGSGPTAPAEESPRNDSNYHYTEADFEFSPPRSNQSAGSDSDHEDEGQSMPPPLTAQETELRSMAGDYERVFGGHCNTTTDIKEAVFIGRSGRFIAAGSDDGNLFIWDRETSNLVKVLRADSSIVNCVQSHPDVCMLATSGIESVVKLWSPLDQSATDSVPDDASRLSRIAHENQTRMSTDPVEMMILQMGDFVEGWVEVNNDNASNQQPNNRLQCRPS